MVLLYKDPNGEGLEDTGTDTQTSGSRRKSNIALKVDSSELEGKIADLERKLTQRDETIDKMKSEMEAAQKVSIICTHYYCCRVYYYALMQLTTQYLNNYDTTSEC